MLQKTNEDLDSFAYIATHDLKEPLRVISNYTDLLKLSLLKQGLLKDSKDLDYFQYIVAGVKKMNEMIKDILEFSQIGKEEEEDFLELDVQVILDEVLKSFSEPIAEKKVKVLVRTLMPILRANPMQLSSLFQNLLGNAIKYGNEVDPTIEILAEPLATGGYLFIVRDNGIGIEAKYFEQIFLLFKRLHSKDEYPGTGIGLAICKKVVELHKGRIWLESSPGAGTTFFFTIET